MDIKLTKHEDDVYSIIRRVSLRDNQFDQEKEHLWIIGMNHPIYRTDCAWQL